MSDNDLIRRGDALSACRDAMTLDGSLQRIAALPAVTVGVPLKQIGTGLYEQPAPDAAAIREAALQEAADLVNRRVDGVRVSIPCPDGKSGCLVHHFRIEDGPTAKAILALITEKPHD